jgi:hypothetical protein
MPNSHANHWANGSLRYEAIEKQWFYALRRMYVCMYVAQWGQTIFEGVFLFLYFCVSVFMQNTVHALCFMSNVYVQQYLPQNGF